MGREQVEITKFLKAIMLATGCWRLKLTNNRFIQTLYSIYSTFFQCGALFFFLSSLLKLPSLLKQKQFQLAVENISYSIFLLVIITKIIISQTTKIRNLILQCILEEIRTYQEEPKIIQNNFLENVKVLNRINTVTLVLTILTVFALCSAKYADYAEYKNVNTTIKKPLPLPISYPFNPTEYYGTAFIVAACFYMVAGINNIVTQITFFTLMTYAALQIRALKIIAVDFHLYCETGNEYNEEKNIMATLRDICIKHQHIISFVDELNIAIKNVLLLEFILNSFSIASVLVQIIIMPNTRIMIDALVFYCMAQILQLFLMSWQANEIQLESITLCDALFQSRWYAQSERAKRIIFIIMLRSRKPLSLFIGPFYPMMNSTALGTVKAAYSYVALITTVAAKGQLTR